jgi:uncharacterized protein with HEPN domain
MRADKRDVFVLNKIVGYCDTIQRTNVYFGGTEEILRENEIYLNALSMCILQIGELTAQLSQQFKARFTKVPWQKMKAMRNIAVHHYGEFSISTLWETVTDDIEPLRSYCAACISELEQKNQDE